MSDAGGIYLIVNATNGHRYIGQTINFRRRWNEHRTKRSYGRSVLGRAFAKHGKNVFKFHVAALRPEYNMTPGGTGKGKVFPAEAKAILSVKGKAQWARMTPEQQAATVKRMQDNRMPPSAATRAKIGEDRRQYRREHPDFLLKPVVQMDGSANNLAYFKSVNDAARSAGIHPSAISRAVNGKRILAAGHFWKYKRERNNQ